MHGGRGDERWPGTAGQGAARRRSGSRGWKGRVRCRVGAPPAGGRFFGSGRPLPGGRERPPSHVPKSAMTVPDATTTASESMLRKVRGLLDKAENTGFEHEK